MRAQWGAAAASWNAASADLQAWLAASTETMQTLAGVQAMYTALRPGGRLCTMGFADREHNACLAILMATALEHAGLPAPDAETPGGLLCLGRPG